jgi:polyisoprenoid-binding protein YceI
MQINSRIWLAPVILAVAFHVGQARSAEVLKLTSKAGTIEFVGAKPGGTHKGGFKEFAGTVKLDTEQPAASQVVLEIDTGSLWADDPKLTEHLKNADFFDVGKHPKAVFKSTGLREPTPEERKVKGNEKITHILSGELTLMGIKKKIEPPLTILVSEKLLSVSGRYSLDRTQFGMTYGKGKIEDAAQVTISLEIPRGKAAGTE